MSSTQSLIQTATDRVRRLVRLLVALSLALAILAIARPASAAAADAGLSNTARSRSGATMSSYGFCGGSTFNFTMDWAGVEYLRINALTANGMIYGTLAQVPRVGHYTLQLPLQVQYKAYVIEGYDWNSALQVWDSLTVVTSFTQVPNLDYSTWFC